MALLLFPLEREDLKTNLHQPKFVSSILITETSVNLPTVVAGIVNN